MRQEEERKQTLVKKTEMVQKVEQTNHMEELKKQEEMRIMERKRLEQQIQRESQVVTGQVSKRADDVHGLGWGHVTTGFVSRKKLGFLQSADSVERDWSMEGSPGPGGRTRGLRVTFAESPGSRPESAQSIDRAQQLRAQTPPLAGEWQQGASFSMQQSSSKSSSSATFSDQKSSSSKSASFFSSSQSSSFQQTSSMNASQSFEAFPGMGRIENMKL